MNFPEGSTSWTKLVHVYQNVTHSYSSKVKTWRIPTRDAFLLVAFLQNFPLKSCMQIFVRKPAKKNGQPSAHVPYTVRTSLDVHVRVALGFTQDADRNKSRIDANFAAVR